MIKDFTVLIKDLDLFEGDMITYLKTRRKQASKHGSAWVGLYFQICSPKRYQAFWDEKN